VAEIRYQFDEHIVGVVALALRRHGIEVTTAAEAGLLGSPDTDVLAHAHAHSRVVVTRDKDFLRLHASGQSHSGIVFFGKRIRTIGELIEVLVLVHEAVSPEEIQGRVEYG
jgi:predicted nuclease of predicted toxin-antitoxin system